MLTRYNLVSELSGKKYESLLRYAVGKGLVVLLVDTCGYSSEKRANFVNAMEPYLKSMKKVSCWPGTQLTDQKVPVYRYRLNEKSCALILNVSKGLFDWEQPDLLEDLCLLRPDDSVFMTATTSERDAYFDITESEMAELTHQIPGMELASDGRHR